MISKKELNEIKARFLRIKPELNERTKRLWAAVEANKLGRGGVTAVSKATGIAISTIRIGQRELKENPAAMNLDNTGGIRKKGGGRKSLIQNNPDLIMGLDALIKPFPDEFSIPPLRWTCKSTRRLSGELSERGYRISHSKVAQLLSYFGYSVRSGQHRIVKGGSFSDKNAQFRFINEKVIEFHNMGWPVIYVDVRNRELNEHVPDDDKKKQKDGKSEEQAFHDFSELTKGKESMTGIFDTMMNQNRMNRDWVHIEFEHDSVHFAVSSIYQWWLQMSKNAYPYAKELLIITDILTGNDALGILWKKMFQELADKTKLDITVCHFPQGTYKWNKIGHNMSSHILKNWPKKPLMRHEVTVNFIANTIRDKDLTITGNSGADSYSKVSDKTMQFVVEKRNIFYNEWNYTIRSLSK